MNKPIKKLIVFFGGGIVLLLGCFIFLFFDAFYGGAHFRTMQDKILSHEQIDLTGLKELQASGGNTPRFPDVYRRLRHVKKDKIVIDAIADFHGYIKSIPISFLGYSRPKAPALRHALRRFILTGSLRVLPKYVIPESIEAKKYGFEYKSFLITSKFVTDAKIVDSFIDFIDVLPNDVWIHFHCAHGKGRTSMMLVMFDILKNAPTVSLQDIVKRQHLLGAPNLFDTTLWENGTYSQEQLNNRKKFIENFYEFISQRKLGGIQRWSEWQRSLES